MELAHQYFTTKTLKVFKKGEIILHQGDLSCCIYMVKKGYVRVYDIDENGSQKLIAIFGKNHIFPHLRLGYKPAPSAYYWEAVMDTELYSVPTDEILLDIKTDPNLGLSLYQYATKLIDTLQERVLGLLQTFTSRKIPLVLRYLIDDIGQVENGIGSINMPLSHQDIASLGGLARETASIEMKKLKDESVVSYQGRKMLVNIKKLEKHY